MHLIQCVGVYILHYAGNTITLLSWNIQLITKYFLNIILSTNPSIQDFRKRTARRMEKRIYRSSIIV